MNYAIYRRCSENAFGIMVNRWRIMRGCLNLLPENCDKVIKACTALHNFLLTIGKQNSHYCPASYRDRLLPNGKYVQGSWRKENVNLAPLEPRQNQNSREDAEEVRQKFVDYVNNEGAVTWQDDYAYLHDY